MNRTVALHATSTTCKNKHTWACFQAQLVICKSVRCAFCVRRWRGETSTTTTTTTEDELGSNFRVGKTVSQWFSVGNGTNGKRVSTREFYSVYNKMHTSHSAQHSATSYIHTYANWRIRMWTINWIACVTNYGYESNWTAMFLRWCSKYIKLHSCSLIASAEWRTHAVATLTQPIQNQTQNQLTITTTISVCLSLWCLFCTSYMYVVCVRTCQTKNPYH